jgi:hypothetical protein
MHGVAGLMRILVAVRRAAESICARLVSGVLVPTLAVTELLLPALRGRAGLLLRLLSGVWLEALRLLRCASLKLSDKLSAIRLSGIEALVLALAAPAAAAFGLAHPMRDRISTRLKGLVLTADSARLGRRHYWSLGDLPLGHVLL